MVDKPALIKNLLFIDNKQGIVTPFKLNRMQRYFFKYKSNRNIVLKHRQGGLSSVVLADMFTDCITIPHTQCAVVSHEGRSTQRLLDRVQFFYDSMQSPKPEIGAESRSEKTFPDKHSSIYIGTAGARAFGRGDTIRKALMSELPQYEDGERVLSGVEDAVPLTGELDIEATPYGEDNVFFVRWTRAKEGKSPYRPFFFPWWWSADYTIPRGSDFVLLVDKEELSYTDEELELIEIYKRYAARYPEWLPPNMTEGQIRWRRWKIGEKSGLFWQEYPEDEVSCFITIGDPVFDQYILTQLAQGSYEGEHHTQGWTFWRKPQEKFRYIIGVDSSAGAPEGSYSAAVVLNDLWEVCATFQARLDPHTFAGILKEMGKWYNTAEIAVERNFTGYAVLEQLRDYPNIYHQRDFTTGKVTTQKGWWTNDQTRDLLMTVAKEKFPQLKMWDVNLIRQLRSYRYLKLKKKYREEAQTFDDLAMAMMIACVVKKVEGGARGYQGNVASWDW